MTRYQLSLDGGETWKPIRKWAARRRLAHVVFEPELAFLAADKGQVIDMGGYGLLRHRPRKLRGRPRNPATRALRFGANEAAQGLRKNPQNAGV